MILAELKSRLRLYARRIGMDEKSELVRLGRTQRASTGEPMTTQHISLPEYLLALIREEAREKNKSVSLVASYLILAGLKAHVGEFAPPRDNTILRNYKNRGRKWS
jgi:hypothetical protein